MLRSRIFDSVIEEASLDAISKVFEFRNKYFSIQAEEDPAGLFAEHLRQFRKTKRIPSFQSEKRCLYLIEFINISQT